MNDLCWYSKCENKIREEDKKLKPETVKLCERHNEQLKRLSDGDNIGALVKFMLLCGENK